MDGCGWAILGEVASCVTSDMTSLGDVTVAEDIVLSMKGAGRELAEEPLPPPRSLFGSTEDRGEEIEDFDTDIMEELVRRQPYCRRVGGTSGGTLGGTSRTLTLDLKGACIDSLHPSAALFGSS